MKCRGRKKNCGILKTASVAAIFVLSCVIGYFVLRTNSCHDSGLFKKLLVAEVSRRRHENTPEIDPHSWLRKENMANTGSIPCLWITIEEMQVPICSYNPNDDIYVSKAVQEGGTAYEQSTVVRVIRLLRRSSNDVQLVDIGANIGSFTLPVSRFAPVIAVEPNWETMSRLVTSVVLGNVDQNVTLLYSAVSNKRTTLNIAFDPTNRGHTVMTSNASCASAPFGLRCLRRPVETVLLNDLLPLVKHRRAVIKADVEGHEVNVFTEDSAGAFFKTIDVPLLIMEWMHNVPLSQKNPNFAAQVESLISFFHRRNYKFFAPNNKQLNKNYWRYWPNDVYITKNNYGLRSLLKTD